MKREINDLVDSLEYLDGKTVEFDEISCCALDRAFEKNPETTSQLRQVTEEKESFDGFREILSKTEELKFIPVDNIKTVCGQIAKRELERISAEDELDSELLCGHTIDQHEEALKKIVKDMEPTVN